MRECFAAAIAAVLLLVFQTSAAESLKFSGDPPPTVTVATLPTCNDTTMKGAKRKVSDSNTTAAGTTVSAGGDNLVVVECDGTSWVIDAVGGGTSIQGSQFNYARSGCASASATTTGGCNGEGLWLIRTDHHWANSPGVRHSTTGASYVGAAAGASDSPGHNSEQLRIGGNVAVSGCDPFSVFCTTMSGAFDGSVIDEEFDIYAAGDAEADPHFCRNNTTPYATCSTGATCVSSITGADDPETFVVQHANYNTAGDLTGYTYLPVFVTAYSGCNSATNTITMQPAKVGTNLPSRFLVGIGDLVQAAYNDAVHPAPFYGGYLAQSVMLARIGSHFEPRVNLAGVNGYGDDETACDSVADSTGASNSATAATNAVAHDPTKAAYLGSWSSVSGGACTYTGAESNAIQLPTFPVTGGAYYNVRVRAGVSDLTNLTLTIKDNTNATVTGKWFPTLRADNTFPQQSSASNINAGGGSGWNTFVVKVQAPEAATTLRIEIARTATTGNVYWDDYVVWPSIDPGPDDNYILPSGRHKALLISDSRGATAELAQNLRDAAAFLRPDVDLDLTDDSVYARTLGTQCTAGDGFCWNWASSWNQAEGVLTEGRAEWYAGHGYDTAFVFLGVNDFALVSGGVRPSYMMRNVMETVSALRQAGVRVIWIQEPPVAGNSTFSGTSSVCRDSNGSTPLGCGRYVERLYRLLTRGGFVN